MKAKLLFLLVALFATTTVNSQVMRAEELEKYAKERYGEKWTEAAENLASQLSLDKNNSLTYEQIIDCGESTKEQLYVILNYWFTATFNDANSVIKLNDKELGTIIAEGYVADIAGHMGGMNSYNVNIRPIIKVDIKDKRIRVTYTVQYYDIEKLSGGGILSAVGESMGALGGNPTPTKKELLEEHWGLETCFPFAKKDKHKAKKTSSKALVMTHAYSNVIMDKIEETVKNGLVGNENDGSVRKAGCNPCSRFQYYAHNLDSLNKKNGMSATPLNWLLKAFTLALNDSAPALVCLFTKKWVSPKSRLQSLLPFSVLCTQFG